VTLIYAHNITSPLENQLVLELGCRKLRPGVTPDCPGGCCGRRAEVQELGSVQHALGEHEHNRRVAQPNFALLVR
jgi:hypothetical protein